MEKYTFIALSHCKASDGLAENGAGRAVLISVVDMVVPIEDWIDMGFEGLTGFAESTGVGMTIVAGLTDVRMWGKGLLSYPIRLTKSTLAVQSTSDPLRNQLQRVLAQDSLPDLRTCIRVPSRHPPF